MHKIKRKWGYLWNNVMIFHNCIRQSSLLVRCILFRKVIISDLKYICNYNHLKLIFWRNGLSLKDIRKNDRSLFTYLFVVYVDFRLYLGSFGYEQQTKAWLFCIRSKGDNSYILSFKAKQCVCLMVSDIFFQLNTSFN